MLSDLEKNLKRAVKRKIREDMPCNSVAENPKNEEEAKLRGLVQWTSSDDKRYVPASQTTLKIAPGVYDINSSPNIGIYFEKLPIITHDLIRFPQTNSDVVIGEIQKFWEREHLFKEYKLLYKRGILLFGPPGGGKSCTVQLIMHDIVERAGVVIKFTHPSLFTEGMRIFREIEPLTPIVVLMEDIDAIIENYNESEVLNILDGVNQIDRAVFLATTNYPERLGPRIINRPSRFDKRFKIGHPNAESRKMYFEHIIGKEKIKTLKIDLDKWVKDTAKMSIAHLKELFVAVVILGDSYKDAIKTLAKMQDDKLDSAEDYEKNMGFGYESTASGVYSTSSGY